MRAVLYVIQDSSNKAMTMPQTKTNHDLRVTDSGHWNESQMPRPCEFQNLTGCCDMTQETRTAQCRNKEKEKQNSFLKC